MSKGVICLDVVVVVGIALALPGCSSSDRIMTSTAADPPCSDATGNRFVDCGNGTVTDTQTGLIWLKDASCLGSESFNTANRLAADLGQGTHAACNLTDGSIPGEWRLPSLECPTGSIFSCILADCAFCAVASM